MKREDIQKLSLPFMDDLVSALLDYADSKTPLDGKNIKVSDTAGDTGRTIDSTGTATPAIQPSFSLYAAMIDGGQGIGVTFGNVTCYAKADGVQPWPINFSADATPPWTCILPVAGDGVVWIEFDNDATDGIYSLSEMSIDNGETVPDDVDGNTFLPLGNYTYNSTDGLKILNPIGIGDQFYGYCNGIPDYRTV